MSDSHALPDDLPPALVFTDAAARKVGSLIDTVSREPFARPS